jgi:hypothetical protein
MKTRSCSSILVTALVGLAITAPVVAQEQHQTAGGDTSRGVAAKKHNHYKLIDIGTFGGPASWVSPQFFASRVLSMRGVTVGGSSTSTPTSCGPQKSRPAGVEWLGVSGVA